MARRGSQQPPLLNTVQLCPVLEEKNKTLCSKWKSMICVHILISTFEWGKSYNLRFNKISLIYLAHDHHHLLLRQGDKCICPCHCICICHCISVCQLDFSDVFSARPAPSPPPTMWPWGFHTRSVITPQDGIWKTLTSWHLLCQQERWINVDRNHLKTSHLA